MTNEEVIARLREDDTDFWHCEAADRIEALTEQLNICRMAQVVIDNTVADLKRERDRQYDENVHRIAEEAKAEARAEAAEDKLAKAMTHVMDYSNDPHLVQFARTTLAEIEGEKT
jgi:uncharacterized protein (UPF0147 family)